MELRAFWEARVELEHADPQELQDSLDLLGIVGPQDSQEILVLLEEQVQLV